MDNSSFHAGQFSQFSFTLVALFVRKTGCSVRYLDATIKAAIRVWNRVEEYTLSIPFRSNGRYYWRSGWAIFAGRSSLGVGRHTAAEQAVSGAFHSRRVRGGSVRQICRAISRKGNSTTSEGGCLSNWIRIHRDRGCRRRGSATEQSQTPSEGAPTGASLDWRLSPDDKSETVKNNLKR